MKKIILSAAIAATAMCANAQTDYKIQTACNPLDVKTYDTNRLRSAFAMENVMEANKIHFTYSMYDRLVFGGAMPVGTVLKLGLAAVGMYLLVLRAEAFLNHLWGVRA